MRLMPKIISAGFALCALASASMPAFSWAQADLDRSGSVVVAAAPADRR